MKLFQRLLVAPAALGLLASGANAAELNINGVSDYAATASGNSLDQVTSVTQFSDVDPTDWAYQALANLVETYGCVAGYPNGSFHGNRAMPMPIQMPAPSRCPWEPRRSTRDLDQLLTTSSSAPWPISRPRK